MLTMQGAPPADTESPDVSVILPIRNEGAHILAVLADLQAQELGDLTIEIVVVDGESTDDTVAKVEAAAQADPRIKLFNNPRRLSSAARALGAENAYGRFLAYVDGHCRIPSRTLIADMVDLFVRTQADALSRPQPLASDAGDTLTRAIAAGRSSPFGHSLRSTIYDDSEHEVSPVSAGAMYRRTVFAKVGNFDPAFDACEDVEFNYRVKQAGLVCWTSPKLAVEYEPRRTLPALFRQMFRYGLGRARLHAKHPESFSIESLVPAAFVLGLVLLLLAPFLPAPWYWLVLGPWTAYLVLSLAASAVTAARTGWALFPVLPLVFATIHAGLGCGYLKGRVSSPPETTEATT